MKKIVVILLSLILAISMIGCTTTDTATDTATEAPAATDAPAEDAATETPAETEDEPVETLPADEDVPTGDIAELEEIIATAQQLPEFTYTNDVVDAKSLMEGKKVMSIPSNSSNPFATGGCELVGELLNEVGAENFIWENAGTPDEWNTGIQNAINQNYDFVQMYGGCNPGMVAGGYELLQQAGIPLMTSHYGQAGAEIDTADYRLGMDFYDAGRLMAAWTVVQGGTDVKVAVLAEYDTESGPQIVQGMKDVYEVYAPDATVEFVTVPINDWATKCQNETQNAIQRIQGLNYVVPIYDSMLQYVVPGIEMAGQTGTVKAISYNGTPFCLDLVREGSVEMIVGESIDWISYATVDTIIRAFNGNTEQIDEKVPHYLFTADNIADAGDPAEYGMGYGDAYVQGYRTLWGLD